MSAARPEDLSPLARQQAALLAALFDRPAGNAIKKLAGHAYLTSAGAQSEGTNQPLTALAPLARRGFAVYQANGHELAARALAAAFPVLAQMLGDNNLASLARAFWHAAPPDRGDMAQWGGGLPGFIAASAQLQEEPCLPDVARVEWALHRAAGVADESVDLASFGQLTSAEPATAALRISAAASVIESPWPVVSLIQAHGVQAGPDHGGGVEDDAQGGASPREAALAEAARLLNGRVAQTAVVWRQGLRPMLREATPGEAALLAQVQAGASLSDALDAAPALDFSAWLPMAVQTGLLLGVQV
jgi:hypothetical protein